MLGLTPKRLAGLFLLRMDVYQPCTNDGRVVLWLNHWGQASPKASRRFPAFTGFSPAELLGRPTR